MGRPCGRPCRATKEPGRRRRGLSTAPVRGPAVHLCVAAGPGDSRRPPQVGRGLRERPRGPQGRCDGCWSCRRGLAVSSGG